MTKLSDINAMCKHAFLGKYYPNTARLISFLRATQAPIMRSVPGVTRNAYHETKPAIKAMAKDFPHWVVNQNLDHPVRSTAINVGLGTAAAAPILYYTGKAKGRDDMAKQPEDVQDDILSAILDPGSMSDQQKIDAVAGAGAAALGGAGLYAAMKAIPGLKRRKVLRAVLATLGGAGIGYGAWKATDNIQNNTVKV